MIGPGDRSLGDITPFLITLLAVLLGFAAYAFLPGAIGKIAAVE